MIDDIDRRTLMGADQEDESGRRQPLFWLLWALLIFTVLFGCGQIATWFDTSGLEDVEVRSGLTVDYGIWMPVAFGGISPLIIAEAAGDNGGDIFLASIPSNSCFLLGDCTPNPPTPTSTPTSTPTITSTPTSTPTPTYTPTPTSTFFPTFTFTPTDTPTITPTPTNTPTPTPQVYPIKIANPGNIPPGPTTLQFSIIVINYGSIPPAHLTAVIDRLPPGMSYNGGCVPACGASPGDTTITWIVDEWIPQSGFSRFRFIANANGIAGEVFLNEVETQGGNFETSFNVKRVYVYTPTPTSTPITIPVANDDPNGAPAVTYATNEDNPLSIIAPGLLANDTDAAWDTLSASPLGAPSNGTAVINADGSFTYTPFANYFGSDTFTYEACDGGGSCDSATVYITVNSVEDIPIAVDDVYSVDEDITLIRSALTGVLSNDSDGDGDILGATLLAGPTNASSFSLNSDGSFSYQPDPHYFGLDQFTYEACDPAPLPNGDCDNAVVDITIESVNDPPVAVDDPTPVGGPPFPRFNTDEDIPIDIDVLANDYEDPVEGDTISIFSIPGSPANGSVVININGTPLDPSDDFITYSPALHYYGNDSFTYRISDGNGGFDDALVRITVDPINDAPTALDDSGTMGAFDPPLAVDVLANDADLVEGEPLEIISVQSSIDLGGIQTTTDQGGLASINDNGTPGNTTDDFVDYDPQGYSHPTIADTFTYTISDGQPINNTDTATVSIIVNDAPIAESDSAPTLEDNSVPIDVLTNDALSEPNGDTVELIAGSVTNPANGTVSVNDAGTPLDRSDDFIDYTPNLNYFGIDTFTYQITDTGLNSNVATVTVTVTAVNDLPVAADDDFRTDRNTAANFDVLLNDTDVDLDTLSVQSATDGANGTVTNNGTDVTYDPDTNFVGGDSFTYIVSDGNGGTDSATVIVVVSGRPEANPESYTTNEDTPLAVPSVLFPNGVLDNDTDPNPGDTLTASLNLANPIASGTLVLNPDGSFTYDPFSNFNGNDDFMYDACDPGGLCDSATVNITVVSDNDAPVANNDPDGAPLTPPFSFFTDEDSPILIDVTSNDTDVDGTIDNSSVVIASPPSSGLVINHLDGTVTYTPNADYLTVGGSNLNIWFSYTVDDNDGDTSSPGWVYVAITPINDPPVAVDDDRETGQDVTITINVMSNDYDVDTGDTISILSFDLVGSNGATITQVGNRLEYDPLPTFSHPTVPETFAYTIEDTLFATGGPATVSVIVNDAPIAVDDSETTLEDNPVAIFVLANDALVEPNGDPVEIVAGSISSPSLGTVSINDNGTPGDRTDDFIDYVPDPNVFGTGDTFTYIITDGGLDSNTATVTVDVTAVNDDPVAQDDTFRTNVDTPGVFDVLGNDNDIDSASLTVLTVTDGTQGTVANNLTDVTYTPNAGYIGPDSFSYIVTDGDGGSDGANVGVVVNGPPQADAETYNTQEDTPLNIAAPGVLDGDTDPNSDSLTASVVSTTSNGTLNLNGDGSFDYNPNADFNGTDQFTYEACDPGSPGQPQLCDNATVTINISALPDPPVASDDATSVDEDNPLNVASPGVLSNDDDPDNLVGNPWDGLTITLTSGPSDADNFDLFGDGSFDYVPLPDYHGSDSFQYEACDPTSRCDTATVNITVNSINDPPIAVNDGPESTDEDTPITIDVLLNDYEDPVEGDTLSVGGVTQGAWGSVTNNGTDVTYDPNAESLAEGVIQPDTFTYTLSDGNGGTDTADVTVQITGVNDAPNAVDDPGFTMGQFDSPLPIFVLVNDSDVDVPDTISISSCDNPSLSLGGSVDCSGPSIVYTPNTAPGGSDPLNPDTFDYLISDSIGATDSATVSILVNDPPSAVDDGVYTVDEDNQLIVDAAAGVLANDSDPNGDPLYPSVTSTTTNGSLSLSSDGSFTYDPIANYFGSDQFTYEICDAPGGAGYCASAIALITINSVNDQPIATNNSGTSDQPTATTTGITIDVASDDSDLEGNVVPGSVLISSPPAHGTAVANGDGTVTYTLTEPWFASDSFEYTIQDDQIPTAISAPATVSITITPPILTVAKDASQSQAVLNDLIEFYIYVINDGPGTAYSVDLSDSLGNCFQWEAGSPDGLLGDLADGAAVVVGPVSARVINTSGCSNENRASVTSINGASASGSVTITLISGTHFPLFFPLLVFAWPLLRTVYRKIRKPF